MPYYCKNCGAVVSGKYCSCCGTRARSDFQEFILAKRRIERNASKTAEIDQRFSGIYSIYASRIASLAFEIAFTRIIPRKAVNADIFDSYSDYCWKKLPECQELAEILYDRAVDALLLTKEKEMP